MMQGEDRKKRKQNLNPRSASEEYCLRERPKEDTTKMKNKLSTSVVNSKKRPWSWDQYLEEERAIAAPLRLFTETSEVMMNDDTSERVYGIYVQIVFQF